jgi:hypothetical protein
MARTKKNKQLQQPLQQQEEDSANNDESDDEEDEDSADSEEYHDYEEDEDYEDEDRDPLVFRFSGVMWSACSGGDEEVISRLLDQGKNVNCVCDGLIPIQVALRNGFLEAVILLAKRGAKLSRNKSSGENLLHYAAGNLRDDRIIEWVFARTKIKVNSIDKNGNTPIKIACARYCGDVAKYLIEKGANLFMKNNDGDSAIDQALGPQALQHAKDLIWESVKPLLLLSKACSTSLPSTSLIKVFSISGIVRDYITPYIMRKGLIIRDPEEDADLEEPEADEVKLRIEAALAAASSSSSSSSSSVKRAREE